MTRHPQIRIAHDGMSADVDVGLAPLILALWRRHIPTMASCQGDGDGQFGISFPYGWAADAFVKLVKPWRLACALAPDQHPQHILQTEWRWIVNHGDHNGEECVFVHVGIPRRYLPAVLAAAEDPDTRDFGQWLDDERERRTASPQLPFEEGSR